MTGPHRLLVVMLAAATVAAGLVGGFGSVAVLLIGAAAVVAIGRGLTEPYDRRLMLGMTLGALGLRVLLAVVMHIALTARNPEGALLLDDRGYTQIGLALARMWRGAPLPGDDAVVTDPSVSPGYVTLAGAVFWTVGENILALKLVNVIIGVVQGLLIFRTMRNLGLPGATLAAALVLFFPTLVLWSLLTLKDTVAVTAMIAAVWSVSEFQRARRWWPWAITVIALLVLRDIRAYAMVILAIAWPAGLLVATRAARWRASLAALTIGSFLVATSYPALQLVTLNAIGRAVEVRAAMAQGARSAFVEPQPVAEARLGSSFRVEVPGVTTDPAVPVRQHQVPAGTVLAVEGRATPQPLPFGTAPRVVTVRPGDIIVIGPANASPTSTQLQATPAATPTPTSDVSGAPLASGSPSPTLRGVVVRPESLNVITTPPPADQPGGTVGPTRSATADGIQAHLRHLPVGMLFLFAAPFPLAPRTFAELALAPEMILWYLMLGFAAAGLVDAVRRRELGLAMAVLTLFGTALVLSLAEGNVGTLVRHRAMVVPFVAILAAFSLARPGSRAAHLLAGWSRRFKVLTG